MAYTDAQATLNELARLDDAARHPRTQVWFPLLAFGLIDAVGAPLAWIIGRGHLGSYFLPMSVIGGIACVWHYRHTGRTTGLQAPALAWLAVILGAAVTAAACSGIGRDRDLDVLNLAGPAVSFMAAYAILGVWARSTTMLLVVAGIGATAVIVLAFARGDTAIGLQLVGFAVTMLPLAALNYQQSRSVA